MNQEARLNTARWILLRIVSTCARYTIDTPDILADEVGTSSAVSGFAQNSLWKAVRELRALKLLQTPQLHRRTPHVFFEKRNEALTLLQATREMDREAEYFKFFWSCRACGTTFPSWIIDYKCMHADFQVWTHGRWTISSSVPQIPRSPSLANGYWPCHSLANSFTDQIRDQGICISTAAGSRIQFLPDAAGSGGARFMPSSALKINKPIKINKLPSLTLSSLKEKQNATLAMYPWKLTRSHLCMRMF